MDALRQLAAKILASAFAVAITFGVIMFSSRSDTMPSGVPKPASSSDIVYVRSYKTVPIPIDAQTAHPKYCGIADLVLTNGEGVGALIPCDSKLLLGRSRH